MAVGHGGQRSPARGGAAAAGQGVHLLDDAVAAAAAPGSGLEQAARFLEAQLVAPAVGTRGILHVSHPLAVAAGIVDRLAAGDPLLLDGHRLVEEPLELQLGVVRIAGVGALVPDSDTHLEEPDRV